MVPEMIEQGTPEWFEARLGKVTASRISDVMMKPATAGYQNYMAQLACERLTGQPTEGFISAAMQHGTDTEPQARAMYEMVRGADVEQVGFIPHPTLNMSGASPDGLVGADGGLEIKCPQPATHIKTLLGAPIDRKYMLQMQWGMACAEREWWDFVSFSPALPIEMQLFCVRIDRNDAMIAEITDAVSSFLSKIDELCAELSSEYGKDAK